ncbi:MAG: hypothetical protein K0S41_1972 [Anaerocolumna sp.]|jgi:DNA-binding MarR family transcriptional regulator|nr:hypothetical protein [Anaerocolumna sp.]
MLSERTRQLLFSYVKIRKNIHNLLLDTELTRAEYYVLLYLREQSILRNDVTMDPTVKAADISELLGISRPAVTKLLNALEKKEFIKRYISAVDKRSSAIELTASGLNAYQKANTNIYLLSDKLAIDLGMEETKKFVQLLEKISGIYETLLNEKNKVQNKNVKSIHV